MKYFLFIFLLLLVLAGCVNRPEKADQKTWDSIIKEIEIVSAANEPDSIKFTRMQKIFNENSITFEDYQKFYHDYVESDPLINLELLEQIEDSLMQEMREAAKEDRKIMQKGKPLIELKKGMK